MRSQKFDRRSAIPRCLLKRLRSSELLKLPPNAVVLILKLLLLLVLHVLPHRDVSFFTPATLPCAHLTLEYCRVVVPKGIAAGPSIELGFSSQLSRALVGESRAPMRAKTKDEEWDTDILLHVPNPNFKKF